MGDSLVVLVCRYAPTFFLQGMAVNVPGMGHEEELVAWNWKTGQVLAVSIAHYRLASVLMPHLADGAT